jgi:hypothetical protein
MEAHMRRLLSGFIVTTILLAGASPTYAKPRSSGRTALWTIVGAGAGFGLGLFLGLNAFDDAVNSDRKVWTSAIAGAAAGGTLGYLVGRAQRGASTPATKATLSEREVRSLAQSVRLRALRAGQGAMLQSPDAYSTAWQF